jgi:hypothetical protein
MRNPADDESLTRKFMALAEKPLGRERAQNAVTVIKGVETMTNLGPLLATIIVPADDISRNCQLIGTRLGSFSKLGEWS